MENPTQAMQLVFSAMALVGCYGEAQAHAHTQVEYAACYQSSANYNEIASIKKDLVMLTSGFRELDAEYADILRLALADDTIRHLEITTTTELLHALRGVEASIKIATPPVELASDHMALRRAVASLRGRLAQMESLQKQISTIPTYVETGIDFNGLKMLAAVTSARMAGSA